MLKPECVLSDITMKTSTSSMSRSASRGIIAPIVAASMLMIAGITAFVVDLGYQKIVDSELQNVADAAALAGASGFKNPRIPQIQLACDRALKALSLNKAAGSTLNTSSSSNDFQIDMGIAKLNSGKFQFASKVSGLKSCNSINNSTYTVDVNTEFPALRVIVSREQSSTTGEFQSFFSRIFGVDSLGANARSAAMIATPSQVPAGGTLPWAVGVCTRDLLWDSSTGKPRDARSDGLSVSAITIQSAQNAASGGSGCVHKAQFSTLDPSENPNGMGGQGGKNMNSNNIDCSAPNGAAKVACMLQGKLSSPEFSMSGSPLRYPDINIQNGMRVSLYEDLQQFTGKTVLVPLVDGGDMTNGNNSPTELLGFMPIYIESVNPTSGSVIVRIASALKIDDARPNLGNGSFVTAATTRAFPITP